MKRVLIAVEIQIIVLIAGFLIFVYSGVYNIAATSSHYTFLEWVLETTKENSIRRQSRSISEAPLAGLDLQQGLRHFEAMCVLCHGAPDVERSEIGQGMVPRPPQLAERAQAWTPAEIFWVVSHGIKMTGMPAFGPTHSEPELWAVVALVRQLPDLAPEEYRGMAARIRSGEMPVPDRPEEGTPP